MSVARLAQSAQTRNVAVEDRPAGTVDFLPERIDHVALKILTEAAHPVVVCGKVFQSALERVDISKVTGETVVYRGVVAYDALSHRVERQSWRFKVRDGKAVIDETFPVKIYI